MANVNAPFGFRPARHVGGGCLRTRTYSIASGYATDLYAGDPVELTGTGRNIQRAAAGNQDNLGIFVGCTYEHDDYGYVFSNKWPASTAAKNIVATVIDDHLIQFEVQCDSLAEGDVGLLADWEFGTANDMYKKSGAILDVSTAATTGKSLRVEGLAPIPDNEYGAHAVALVRFVEHVNLNAAAGGGGV